MQLLPDAIAVLGSRHGLLWDPPRRRCGIVRFDRHTKLTELHLRAGVIIHGQEYVLPLCPEGQVLDFCDQRTTPCTMSLIGIHAASCLKLKLTVVTPLRPRDAEFSTTPVIGLRLSASTFGGIFRWEKRSIDLKQVQIFLEFSGPALSVEPHGEDSLDLRFNSVRGGTWPGMTDAWDDRKENQPQHDRLVALTGQRMDRRLVQNVNLADDRPQSLDVAWCTWSGPTFDIHGQRHPFRYGRTLADLSAVEAWARAHPAALFDNAAKVDGIIGANNLPASVNHLLAYTLHSWLINTWWVERGGQDFFGVWEGTCYMVSTEDVEYTQSPFYLAVWPDLLKYQLDQWVEFAKDGAVSLGARGDGTLYFSHDIGAHASATGQIYSHDMEVEETTNWLILMYCYWRRTGDEAMLKRHGGAVQKALRFLELCDTDGNGVPDVGVANTIDDASPAIQFGREQTYLAIKTLAAYVCGAALLGASGERYLSLARRMALLVQDNGWLGAHYATLLQQSGILKNPWTHKEMVCQEIPGWDAPQIYTANGIALLDMVGCKLPLDEDKLRTDLQTAARRCLREYGCVHSDFHNDNPQQLEQMLGLVGVAQSPGWVSMNMLRDIAAFYRGLDLRHLADRYWEWQVTTNSQEPKLFFETFCGNNLSFYPRGIAIWGYFDALGGLVIDKVGGVDRAQPAFSQVRVPRLWDADWKAGRCTLLHGPDAADSVSPSTCFSVELP